MNNIPAKLGSMGIVHVVVLNDAKNARPLAEALCEGGLPCAEVTFRTDAAEEAIRIMAEEFPEMLVGAGTVLKRDTIDRAVRAGARFIVSPGLNPDNVQYCLDRGIAMIPGTMTPSEMEKAVGLGLNTVKFFPAEPAGGLAMLKALAAPFTSLRFMPTGGVNANNVREYLSYDRILACGGSWMVKNDLIESGDFRKIKELTAEAAAIVKEIRG